VHHPAHRSLIQPRRVSGLLFRRSQARAATHPAPMTSHPSGVRFFSTTHTRGGSRSSRTPLATFPTRLRREKPTPEACCYRLPAKPHPEGGGTNWTAFVLPLRYA